MDAVWTGADDIGTKPIVARTGLLLSCPRACVALTLMLSIIISAGGVLAQEAPRDSRTVLALYNADREEAPDATRIHKFAELPLNHLGYRLVYRDINHELPEITEAIAVGRVLTWFDVPVPDAEAYLDWSIEAARAGVRFAVLGEMGFDLLDSERIQTRLDLMGLALDGQVDDTEASRVSAVDADVYGFEHGLDPILSPYPALAVIDDGVATHLAIDRTEGIDGTATSNVVTTGPGGGYVPQGYVLFEELSISRVKWIVDPFAFFERAFGGGWRPIPDTTTLSGRRIYFSHIDGDGWNNVSQVETDGVNGQLSAEVILEQIIAPAPDMPVTVGLIAGDVDPELGALPRSAGIARRLFALDQVEVGSHTYTHPFVWQFYAQYDREAELRLIASAVESDNALPYQKLFRFAAGWLGFSPLAEAGTYVATNADLPRAFMKNAFSLSEEVEAATKLTNSLAPTGKVTAIYQWSGDTAPFEEAIRRTRAAGLRNINGGYTRFDNGYPSVAYVSPIARPVGRERQIYAGNSNENNYSNEWTGPFDGQIKLLQTTANTEVPRRLKPFNLYYHMFSGEKPASLAALRQLLDAARADEIIPVRTSRYAEIADGFFSVEIATAGHLRWRVGDRRGLDTVRFDTSAVAVDFARSSGVIGQRVINGSLYVALDAATDAAVVALTPTGSGAVSPPVHLEQSRWQLSALDRRVCGWEVTAAGFGTGEMSWAGAGDATYLVSARRDGRLLWQEPVKAVSGRLTLAPAIDAIDPLRLSFDCEVPG